MKRSILSIATLAVVASISTATGAETGAAKPEPLPALFGVIKVTPANEDRFTRMAVVNQDGDGIGEELPPTVAYSKKNSKEFGLAMAVTDTSLCRRPAERKICRDFAAMIAGKAPALGTDISATRIWGSDFGTVFLTRVDGVRFGGVDAFTAFLGADSQDPPVSEIVLYIYARKGNNLIQLNTPVGKCTARPAPGQSDVAYYRKNCITGAVLKKAAEKGKMLEELYRLKP